jgi:hypothetical protein
MRFSNAAKQKGSLLWARLLRRINKRKLKIKLVAIAKDEAAYLPDWIFHHLQCGFDHISIYVNNTSDNTPEIIKALKPEKRVEFIDGNSFFEDQTRPPQISVYRHELQRSRWQGYTHVMFLDIDEFLLSQNLDLNFRALVSGINEKVCSFQWVHKMDEHELFMPPVTESLVGRRAPQVKSVISTSIAFEHMNAHNVFHPDLDYLLADGSTVHFSRENFSKLSAEEQQAPLKDWFVMHRMLRHEIEYTAALKRGRPIGQNEQSSIFKDNRNGIFDSTKNELFQFPKVALENYNKQRKAFFQRFNLMPEIKRGQDQVLVRYHDVLDMIKNAPLEEAETLQKVLKNITNEEVLAAYQLFLSRHQA